MSTTPPSARREARTTTLHGDVRVDDYAWMKNERWQEVMRDPDRLAPDIRTHLEAENAYTRVQMAATEALQDRLFEEIRGRIKEVDASVPLADGEFFYYHRFTLGGQHPVFCRKRGEDDTEQVLLDGDAEAQGHDYFNVATCAHSPDHRFLAYAIDLNGAEIYAVHIKDLDTGTLLSDVLASCSGSVAWANDSQHIFYAVLDDNHRPVEIRRHRLGTDPADDVSVYEELDPGFFLAVHASDSRRFLVIDAHDHTTSEARLIDANAPQSAPVLVAERERDVEYQISDDGERLLILTNADSAEDFKLVEVPAERPERSRWRDRLAHRPGTLVLSLLVFRSHMARLEREDGLPRIVITDRASGQEHAISLDEPAYSLGLIDGYEFDTQSLHYTYSSPTTPQRTYRYDMASHERVLVKEQEVPSGHDPSHYVTSRRLATSHDGESVPLTVLRHVDTPQDGSAPVVLYGYGSYGISMPASFSVSRLSLVDRGFVHVVAHVRGGTERGYRWYREGKLQRKTNTFLDFIAAAEHLIEQGHARAGRIAALGGSAGGMLVGAVANMRPDLFGAIGAEVPFVDVLNTMCDESLPLTPPEWPEWGNPLTDVEAYRYIQSYSPYDNVEAKPYPPILATAGLTDPRVTYWEPAKWVAKLRARKTDDNLLLLKTNMSAGHAAAAGRFDQIKETAFTYAFFLLVLGRLDAEVGGKG